MKRSFIKILAIILSVTATLSSLTACGNKNGHECSINYTHDQTHHWGECTCGNVKDKEKHKFKDGKCSCGLYEPEFYTDGLIFAPVGEAYVVKNYEGTFPDVVIPYTYEGKPVTEIRSGAFTFDMPIESVVIGDNVTTICDFAFVGCSSLKSVTFGNGVTTIGNSAFYDCSSLTKITIPNGVKSIGEKAFEECYRLVEVVNKSSHLKIKKGSDENGYVGKYALTVYEENYPYDSKVTLDNGFAVYSEGQKKVLVGYFGNETSVTLPSYITKINAYAFYGRNDLVSVVIPSGATAIGEFAFTLCTNLQTVELPEGMLSIGADAFSYCTSLKNATLPSSVKSLGYRVFYECSSLERVTIPDGVTVIGSRSFYNCSSLKSVTLGQNVQTIGFSAFQNCSSLNEITIPESVTLMGSYAFSGCASLRGAKFMNSSGWIADGTSISSEELSNVNTSANHLKDLYSTATWTRN